MKWDDIYGSVKRFAAHTAVRLNQTADLASLQVKLSIAEKNLDEAYGLLGRISYQHFSSDDDLSEKVLAAVNAVDQAKAEVKNAQEQINDAKRRAEAQNAAYEADKAERAAKAEAEARAEAERVAEEIARAARAAQEEQVTAQAIKATAAAPKEASAVSPAVQPATPLTAQSTSEDAIEIEIALEE